MDLAHWRTVPVCNSRLLCRWPLQQRGLKSPVVASERGVPSRWLIRKKEMEPMAGGRWIALMDKSGPEYARLQEMGLLAGADRKFRTYAVGREVQGQR